MSLICRRCYISGMVQGVFYRHSTHQQAIAQNLTGWVKNLPDGRVEVLICGEEAQVQLMLQWLAQGPPRAQVSDVEIIEINYESHAAFEIVR